MAEPPVESDRSTGWFGQLSETPLFAVLRRIQRQRLTGTLTISREDESRRLFFENGELRSANSSREEHRIGNHLVLWGYISQKELQDALALRRDNQARLDQILVEKGWVTRAVVDAEARRLMEQIVFSTLSWRKGDFCFVNSAGVIDSDIAFSLSVTEMIIEGIRRIPESEQFLASLGDLSSIPTSTENAMSDPASLRLSSEAAYLLSRIDGKTDARTLIQLAPGSRMVGAKILAALIYAGFVEMRLPQKGTAQGPSAPKDEGATFGSETPPVHREEKDEHREFVRNTYRRIDWLSHYDLLGISRNSSPEEIEEACQLRSRLFDPSLQQTPHLADCGRELNVLSQRLRLAREVVGNPSSRADYDRQIDEAHPVILDASMDDTQTRKRRTASAAKLRAWTASRCYEKAKELIEKKDFFPAIQMLSEAVHFVPDSAEYRYLLGTALLKNRMRKQNALDHLQEAARLDPSRADIQASLAGAYLDKGSPQEALGCARRARELDPSNETYGDLERRIEEALQIPRPEGEQESST